VATPRTRVGSLGSSFENAALALDSARARLVTVRAAAAGGAYRDAGAYARDAEAAIADPVRARLGRARDLQNAGAPDAAEAELAALHAAYPKHTEIAGAYARLLVTRARYHDARAVAATGGPLTGLRAEAAGLAAYYLGELKVADVAFAALEVGAVMGDDGATAGRASSLRGMVALERGQLGLASDRYREAARRLGEAGARQEAATAELHLGTVLIERGRASEALPRLTAAARVCAELGAAAESCAAKIARVRALLLLGQLDDARAAADAAIACAEDARHLQALARLAAGDVQHRLGDDAGAIRSYREALTLAAQRGDPQAQLRAYIALAEVGQRDGDDAAIEALCATEDDRDRWLLARGRRALRDPSSVAGPRPAGPLAVTGPHPISLPGEAPRVTSTRAADSLGDATVALARACAEVAARATDADRIERAFRGHAIAAQLAHRARDLEVARSEAERARVAHATWIAATAPAFRTALDGDPDLVRLPAIAPSEPARPLRDDPQAAASVLGELANLAAIAIENARLTNELQRTIRELDERNHQLSTELAARDAELAHIPAPAPAQCEPATMQPEPITTRPEPARPAPGEDLRLRPALAATEQAYLAAAMARAQGNQTVAARLLGLSRFGLQKKLRRRASD
jgi:predicted ATP-grasp superfamily ATP-dependent carboligase